MHTNKIYSIHIYKIVIMSQATKYTLHRITNLLKCLIPERLCAAETMEKKISK